MRDHLRDQSLLSHVSHAVNSQGATSATFNILLRPRIKESSTMSIRCSPLKAADDLPTKNRTKFHLGMVAILLVASLSVSRRFAALSLYNGGLIFLILYSIANVLIGNAILHFELYLGAYTDEGPIYAFSMLPLFEGLGLSMALALWCKSITTSAIAAVDVIYLFDSLADAPLPWTNCTKVQSSGENYTKAITYAYKPDTKLCSIPDPSVPATPSFDYLYNQIFNVIDSKMYGKPNVRIVKVLLMLWIFIFLVMWLEKSQRQAVHWTSVFALVLPLPFVLNIGIFVIAVYVTKDFTPYDIFFVISWEYLKNPETWHHAILMSFFTHASGLGPGIILGRSILFFTSYLDEELYSISYAITFSSMAAATLNAFAVFACCAAGDEYTDIRQVIQTVGNMGASKMWVYPIYSRAFSLSDYSHSKSQMVFFSLALIDIILLLFLIKCTAYCLHQINWYFGMTEMKLIFFISLIGFIASLAFSFQGGIYLLESVDVICGVTAICGVELFAMVYSYGAEYFLHCLHGTPLMKFCIKRLSFTWKVIIIIALALTVGKSVILYYVDVPHGYKYAACCRLVFILLPLPLYALYNTLTATRKPPNDLHHSHSP